MIYWIYCWFINGLFNIHSFFDLFKSMSEPDFYNRINPIDAYNRYLELETLYLSKKSCKKPIKITNRRAR